MSPTEIPTVELHRHFEAGLSPETIARLAEKNGITAAFTRQGARMEGLDPQDPRSIRAYYAAIAAGFKGEGGFTRFLDSFGLPLSVLASLEDLEEAAFSQLVELAAAGSLHTELRGSPFSYQERVGAPLAEIIDALARGVERAFRERGVSGAYLASFSRQKALGPSDGPRSGRQAPEVVAALVAVQDSRRVVGLDVAGFPEVDYPPRMLREALAPAREAGIPLTIHSGEQGRAPDYRDAPPALVIEAMLELGARRIGHGTCLHASAEARSLARERGVGIECCPRSNLLMGFIDALEEHPLRAFLEDGLLASVSTDDPLMFGDFTVAELLSHDAAPLGLGAKERWRLAENGVATAFVTEERRAWLRARLEERRAGA
jgi:adenosine deaminase